MDRFEQYLDKHNTASDEELLHAAVSNTYEYITGELTREDLPMGTWMLRHPRKLATINQLIEYFTETEEYEKCAELVEIKRTIN
jgi:hypothetical protein